MEVSSTIHLNQYYEANVIVIATGYYDHPNYMNIPGEEFTKGISLF